MESFSCIDIPEEWRVQWYERTLLSSDNPNMTLRYSNYFSYVSLAAVTAIKRSEIAASGSPQVVLPFTIRQ